MDETDDLLGTVSSGELEAEYRVAANDNAAEEEALAWIEANADKALDQP